MLFMQPVAIRVVIYYRPYVYVMFDGRITELETAKTSEDEIMHCHRSNSAYRLRPLVTYPLWEKIIWFKMLK